MQKFAARPFSYLGAFAACLIMSMSTGCASGGFKLTRQYAGFVNRQGLIIRIVLYLLTGVVFAVTLLADMVLFNTMDFWDGRVSAGTYDFQQGNKSYQAKHELVPGTGLRRSTIRVFNQKHEPLQEVVLNETQAGEIEIRVDGRLRGRVNGISEVPIASIYDANGAWTGDRVVWPALRETATARADVGAGSGAVVGL